MRKIYIILGVLLLTVASWAQSPQKFSYQAVVRDADEVLLTDQTVGMQISILQGDISGSPVYVETQSPLSNANGLVSLEIGTGDIVSGDFYWFKTIELQGGKQYYLFAAADCTGHGVPGALLSMLGISFLNEISTNLIANCELNNSNELIASEILNKLRQKVKTTLHQTGKSMEQKDGMDITVCTIDLENRTLQFA